MDSSAVIEIPPWGTDSEWKEINMTFNHLINRHRDALARTVEKALEMSHKLESLYPIQNDICRETCVQCSSPCCVTATVWLDFYDLLFMHLTGQLIPDHQLIERQIDSCRYHSPTGCVLPRLSRPWVCTLYLCPPQMALLREKNETIRKHTDETIKAIKTDRKIIEDMFLSIIR